MKTTFSILILLIGVLITWWYLQGAILPNGTILAYNDQGVVTGFLVLISLYGLLGFWSIHPRWLGLPLAAVLVGNLGYQFYLVAWVSYMAQCPVAIH